jgi:hypothetical protein
MTRTSFPAGDGPLAARAPALLATTGLAIVLAIPGPPPAPSSGGTTPAPHPGSSPTASAWSGR